MVLYSFMEYIGHPGIVILPAPQKDFLMSLDERKYENFFASPKNAGSQKAVSREIVGLHRGNTVYIHISATIDRINDPCAQYSGDVGTMFNARHRQQSR